ncbi:MAG: hypothetical protein AAEF72_00465 [Gammaproteobacteria bacterium]
MKNKLLAILLAFTASTSMAGEDSSPFDYNYISAGLGTIKIDGVGSGSLLHFGGAFTSGNLIISGQFATDIESGGDLTATTLGVGYHTPMSIDTDLTFGVAFTKLSLTLDGIGSGSANNTSIGAGINKMISDSTSVSAVLDISLSGGGIGFGFGALYSFTDSMALGFDFTPGDGGSLSVFSLKYSL